MIDIIASDLPDLLKQIDGREVKGDTLKSEGAAIAERASGVVYWPAQLCVLGAILLQVRLPGKLTAGPPWLLPSLEGA